MSAPSQIVSRLGVLLGAFVLLSAVACGSSDDASAGSGGSGGGGGQAGATNAPATLTFDEADTLTLIPSEAHELIVTASPPGSYVVKFSLLGDYKDAALDTSEAETDAAGVSHVTVHAPTTATTFSVRAAVGEAVSAKLGVSVSASGFATVQVAPVYTGKRSVSYWTAGVRTGTTCAALSGNLTSDGDLKGTAPDGQVPQVDSVPVGPALAITLRGGFSIAGCQDVAEVAAGEVNQVKVKVTDLPMQLAETDLDLVLGLDPPKGDLAGLLDTSAVLNALSAGNADDSKALLEAMQAATSGPTDAAAFQLARKTGNWDATLSSALGGPTAIRDLAQPWLSKGVQSLAGASTLEGRLRGAGKLGGHAQIELESIAGVPAADAALPSTALAAWTAEPDDTVLLGTTVFFLPSRLVTAIALGPAKSAAPGAKSVAEALAALLDCQTVGATLAGSGDAFPGCDAKCTEVLCAAGLENLWNGARDASAGASSSSAKWIVAATGQASVDDNARPTSFSGSWIGSFNALETLSVAGPASAEKPPPPR